MPTIATYKDWFADATAILQDKHGIRATAVRQRTWTNWYIRGISPEEAAKHAAAEAWNGLTPNERRMLGR